MSVAIDPPAHVQAISWDGVRLRHIGIVSAKPYSHVATEASAKTPLKGGGGDRPVRV